jgi:iron complex outermembrane recepter protein
MAYLHTRIVRIGFPLLFCCIPTVGAAESVILDEITVRGKAQQPIEEELTIREVRESSARDLGEALQNVPGLNSIRKGAIANDIVLRGFQKDNLNVFLDGVRLHGGCPSRMDPPSFHFDFAEVESVQIIKGPYDLHNPASLAGMINAVSVIPKNGAGLNANLTYGSYNFLDSSATASYGADSYDGLLGYSYKSSDVPESGNGKRITDIYPSTSVNRYRPENLDSKAYETNTFWGKTAYKLAKGRSEIGYAYQDADHVLYPYLLMDADYDRTHRINWTTTLEDLSPLVSKVLVQFWYNQVDHLMDDSLRMSSVPSKMVSRDYMMQTDAKTKTAGGKTNAELRVGPGTLASGVDVYRRNWDAVNDIAGYTMIKPYSPQAMIPDVTIDNAGIFSEYIWPVATNWTLRSGVRLDHTGADADALTAARLTSLYQPYYRGVALDNSAEFTEPSVNMQLTWQTIPALELFGGLASASRTPDPQELYIGLDRMAGTSWVGNPNLEATRNNEADLGVKWKGEGVFASASVFYSDLSDFVYLTNLPAPSTARGPAKSYANIDATIWGAEFGSQVALPYDLFLRGVLSYVRGENDDTSEPLSEIPPFSGNVSLRYDNSQYFVETTLRFAAAQDRVDTSLKEDETAGWGVADLKAGKSWQQWSLVGGINNIFDKQYYSHLSYQRDPFASGVKVPESGAIVYLNLSYHF